MSSKLGYAYRHQQCLLREKEAEIQHLKESVLASKVAAQSTGWRWKGDDRDTGHQWKMDGLIRRIQELECCKENLEKDLSEQTEKTQEALTSAQKAHSLVNQHLTNANKSKEELDKMHVQYRNLSDKCRRLENELEDAGNSLGVLRKQHEDEKEQWKKETDGLSLQVSDLNRQLKSVKDDKAGIEGTNSQLTKENQELLLSLEEAKTKLQIAKTETSSQTTTSMLLMEDVYSQANPDYTSTRTQTTTAETESSLTQTLHITHSSSLTQTNMESGISKSTNTDRTDLLRKDNSSQTNHLFVHSLDVHKFPESLGISSGDHNENSIPTEVSGLSHDPNQSHAFPTTPSRFRNPVSTNDQRFSVPNPITHHSSDGVTGLSEMSYLNYGSKIYANNDCVSSDPIHSNNYSFVSTNGGEITRLTNKNPFTSEFSQNVNNKSFLHESDGIGNDITLFPVNSSSSVTGGDTKNEIRNSDMSVSSDVTLKSACVNKDSNSNITAAPSRPSLRNKTDFSKPLSDIYATAGDEDYQKESLNRFSTLSKIACNSSFLFPESVTPNSYPERYERHRTDSSTLTTSDRTTSHHHDIGKNRSASAPSLYSSNMPSDYRTTSTLLPRTASYSQAMFIKANNSSVQRKDISATAMSHPSDICMDDIVMAKNKTSILSTNASIAPNSVGSLLPTQSATLPLQNQRAICSSTALDSVHNSLKDLKYCPIVEQNFSTHSIIAASSTDVINSTGSNKNRLVIGADNSPLATACNFSANSRDRFLDPSTTSTMQCKIDNDFGTLANMNNDGMFSVRTEASTVFYDDRGLETVPASEKNPDNKVSLKLKRSIPITSASERSSSGTQNCENITPLPLMTANSSKCSNSQILSSSSSMLSKAISNSTISDENPAARIIPSVVKVLDKIHQKKKKRQYQKRVLFTPLIQAARGETATGRDSCGGSINGSQEGDKETCADKDATTSTCGSNGKDNIDVVEGMECMDKPRHPKGILKVPSKRKSNDMTAKSVSFCSPVDLRGKSTPFNPKRLSVSRLWSCFDDNDQVDSTSTRKTDEVEDAFNSRNKTLSTSTSPSLIDDGDDTVMVIPDSPEEMNVHQASTDQDQDQNTNKDTDGPCGHNAALETEKKQI